MPSEDEIRNSTGTDLRFKVGKDTVVRVSSPTELDVPELDRLLRLLEAQRDALKD